MVPIMTSTRSLIETRSDFLFVMYTKDVRMSEYAIVVSKDDPIINSCLILFAAVSFDRVSLKTETLSTTEEKLK